MAQAHSQTAIETLVHIAQNGDSEAARVSAANAILDRGFGKPSQAMEHTGNASDPIKHTFVYVKPDG